MARRSSRSDGLTLAEIARIVGGEPEGNLDWTVRAVAEIEDAGPEDIVFCADARRLALLPGCGAGLVLAPASAELPPGERHGAVRVANPHVAVAALIDALYPLSKAPVGVHETAVAGAGVELGREVSVGPHATLGDGAVVGDRTEIGAGCVLGPGVVVGADCLFHANVTVYDGTEIGDRVILHSGVVLGADGFGYAHDGARHLKVPQVGGVVIEHDVEIGANSCVDRGTLRRTRIGAGTKIDNLVQIGHNCDVGKNCALSGLVGLAGSTVLEDGVVAGGNVGTAGHQRIGAGSLLAAKSGVHGDVPAGSVVGGYPHMEIGVWRRVVSSLAKLPELLRRVRRLERVVEQLDKE